jgi:branched-chain amino acid aminotransferase
MELITDIRIQKVRQSRLPEVDMNELPFGAFVSDHMFLCTYKDGAWQDPAIVPYQNLSLSPATIALHYGQSIFEGMKAFRMQDGRINIFRIEKHFERMSRSMKRMCMPVPSYELFEQALELLVRADKDWVPASEGSALYIRPLIFASEAKFGVKVSDEYKWIIMTSPAGPLYQKPIKVKVERQFIRSAPGGTGSTKCAGNYAGALYPTQKAKQEGFDQVIWTDAISHEQIEESGMMNLMFVIDGKLITPPLSDTILDGITRDALLQIARDQGIETEERPVRISEIRKAFEEKRITEAFGAGTAAVIAPIGLISIDDQVYSLPEITGSSVQIQLKEELEAIRLGRKEDRHGWNHVV